MSVLRPFTFADILAFAVLFIAGWVLTRRMRHLQKHFWLPRLSIIAVVAFLPFVVVPTLLKGNYALASLGTVALALFAYVSATRVRVCKLCGHITPPEDLWVPARLCKKCKAELESPRFFQ